jgi:hypothetical protein
MQAAFFSENSLKQFALICLFLNGLSDGRGALASQSLSEAMS